ncbi:MAG TPA: hypothetical protein VK027_01665 [Chitinophagaceae bacterium]|nr:hypothetical protein [Chitinophagaceae bacterium]
MLQKTILSSFLSFCLMAMTFSISHAQKFKNDYNKLNAYVIAGTTFPYTDVQASEIGYSIGLGIEYKPISFLSANVDVQYGLLQEGHVKTSPIEGAKYKNNFINSSILLNLYPLFLIPNQKAWANDYFNFSIGGGLGFIKNDVEAQDLPIDDIGSVGNYNKTDLLFPVNFSYHFPIWKNNLKDQSISLGINYRYFFSNSDYLDGYKPTLTANEHNDVFAQLSLKVIYSF